MIDDMTTTRPQKTMSIKSYRKMKIKMLEEEFLITLTEEEKEHAKTLTTETELDQFALGIINNRWG